MSNCVIYRAERVPDARQALLNQAVGGNVMEASAGSFRQLLRFASHQAPGQIRLGVTMMYTPKPPGEAQQRMNCYLWCQARQSGLLSTMRSMIETGRLMDLYDLRSVDSVPGPSGELRSCCDLVRQERRIDPQVDPDHIRGALPFYHLIQPLQANTANDYMSLDAVLGHSEQPVMLEMAVQSVDASLQRRTMDRYKTRLQQLGRGGSSSGIRPLSAMGQRDPSELAMGVSVRRHADRVAGEALRRCQAAAQQLEQNQLEFRFNVRAAQQATARSVMAIAAESALMDGAYRLLVHDAPAGAPMPTLEAETMAHPPQASTLGEDAPTVYRDLRPMSILASVEELEGLFRLPVAQVGPPRCIRASTDPSVPHGPGQMIFGVDITGGARSGPTRGILADTLTKSMFVCGVPGTGKSNFLMSQLLEYAGLCGEGRSFLVLELAKREYRLLKGLHADPRPHVRQLAGDIRIYTPGSEVSPLCINPLQRPQGMGVAEHIEQIMPCLEAALDLSGPLRLLTRDALEELYEDYPDPEHPPVLADLVLKADELLGRHDYSSDIKQNIGTALHLRLGSLTHGLVGQVFQCPVGVPSIESILCGRTHIEMDRLPRPAAAFLAMVLMTQISEYVQTQDQCHSGGLRFVVVLDEAHRLIGQNRYGKQGEDQPDPVSHVTDSLCGWIAEYRAQGIGLVIADQLASAMPPEVIKQTGTKVVFRQPDGEDRELLAPSMLLDSLQSEQLARLRVGEAMVMTEGYYGPRLLRTPAMKEKANLVPVPGNRQLRESLRQEPWFRADSRRRCEQQMDVPERRVADGERRVKLAQRAAATIRRVQASKTPIPQSLRDQYAAAARDSAAKLGARRRELMRSWKALLPPADDPALANEALARRRQAVEEKGRRLLQDDMQRVLEQLQAQIAARRA